jgi:pimeloyl-ACP methyl ester carboxylesterase
MPERRPTRVNSIWYCEERDGVRLACRDFGGRGRCVMLLHGLAGYAEEWADTARELSVAHRVVALDQRGHGRSDRAPKDVSQNAFVGDAEFWLERLALAPATVVGQSLGGVTAFLLAARRPDLVSRLIVAEATPDPEPNAIDGVVSWLAEWKRPFGSIDEAVGFFGDTTWGRTWAAGLEVRDDGYWPSFDLDVMTRALRHTAHESYWNDWHSIRCPTLVVRGQGGVREDVVARMLRELPSARAITIADAEHDVHLEQPRQWSQALLAFIPTE